MSPGGCEPRRRFGHQARRGMRGVVVTGQPPHPPRLGQLRTPAFGRNRLPRDLLRGADRPVEQVARRRQTARALHWLREWIVRIERIELPQPSAFTRGDDRRLRRQLRPFDFDQFFRVVTFYDCWSCSFSKLMIEPRNEDRVLGVEAGDHRRSPVQARIGRGITHSKKKIRLKFVVLRAAEKREPRMNAPAVWLDVHPRLQVSSPVERNAPPVGDLGCVANYNALAFRWSGRLSIPVENHSPGLFIIDQRRGIDGDLIAWVGNVNSRFHHVGILVLTLVENRPTAITLVDRDTHDVIAFGHACDVYPLTDELFVVPVSPPGSDSLISAVIAVALAAVVLE